MFKKKLCLVLGILAVCAFSAFAYDGTVLGCDYIDNCSAQEFVELFESDESEELVYNALDSHTDGTIDKFFRITSENIDDEDSDVINNLEGYINNKYDVAEGCVFLTGILRNKTRADADGWYLASYYDGGWTHYMFYFHIEY
ncbi:MAG: hypothetical protein K5829_11235 [Treponema sp.]|nr:hypothetical protein [Treponema sp.]